MPQNRERVFIISIRNDIEQDFEFPIGFDNGIRLKDILESNVDESYYISDEKAEKLIAEYKGKLLKDNQKVIHVGKLNSSQDGIVVDSGGISPTHTAGHGNATKVVIPCITPDRVEKSQNGRRFKEDGEPMFTLASQDRHGILQIGMLDIKGNESIRRVYDEGGISPSLTTMQGGNRQPKVLTKKPKYRIRKLTPKECWRLQGFKDVDFEKAKKALNDCFYRGKDKSNSQLYKQAGNSISVNVPMEIYKILFKDYIKEVGHGH